MYSQMCKQRIYNLSHKDFIRSFVYLPFIYLLSANYY